MRTGTLGNMAAALRKNIRPLVNQILAHRRTFYNQILKNGQQPVLPVVIACGCSVGAGIALYVASKFRNIAQIDTVVYAAKEVAHENELRVVNKVEQTQRELRFLSFASIEYEGQVYMTPQDFLESVMEEIPRPRTGRQRLRREDVQKYLKDTPARHRSNTKLFRTFHDRGIISYTEYLFLLCVLTKPRSGFRIAFNMFDTDGNQRVDKKEFLVLERIITQAQKDPEGQNYHDTTLLVHFFGRKGNDVVKYEDFHRFMENLQTEVLELEFNEFARGMPTITEEEFAKVLLRYTILSKEEHEEYLSRLRQRIPHAMGISFKDFKEFGQFLNNLDDFAIAMRMYTVTDRPISEEEFKRAVKVCTGQNLNDQLVHTVFQLFDIDGDGHLSHKEFISVMRDRLHRGFKCTHYFNYLNTRQSLPTDGRWEIFKHCVKHEMRNA